MLFLWFFFLCALLTSGFPCCFVGPVRFFFEENVFWFLRRRNGKNVRSPTPVDGHLGGVIRSEGLKDGSTWPTIIHGAGSTRAAPWKGAQKPTTRSKRLTNEVSFLRSSKTVGFGLTVRRCAKTVLPGLQTKSVGEARFGNGALETKRCEQGVGIGALSFANRS